MKQFKQESVVVSETRKLNEKQRRFALEFIIDLNATQAALRSSYSAKTAYSQGQRLLKNVEILNLIDELKAERMKRTETEADYVLKRHKQIDSMRLSQIMNNDFTLKPIDQWPAVWDTYIGSAEISELFEGSGNERQMVGILKKIKWPDKLRNLELMGKHVSVQAYSDKSQVEHKVSDLERLMKEIDGTSLGPPSQRNKGVVSNG